MTQALDVAAPGGTPGGAADRVRRVPPEYAPRMMRELPVVIPMVVEEIRATVPAYSRREDSTYDKIIRVSVEKLFTGFIEHIADPTTSLAEWDHICRTLGHFEAVEGRTLDSLYAACRVALNIAWKHTAAVAEREELAYEVMTPMMDTMLRFLDQAAEQARHGYEQALAQADLRRRESRRKLLHAIVARPATPPRTMARMAEAAGWQLPAEVTMVAVARGTGHTRSALDPDVLTDLDGERPCLLIPGPADTRRREMLTAVLDEADSVIGVTVPLRGAADSLRWARRVLELAADGIIAAGPLIECEDHLITVWLMTDQAIMEHLARQHLAPLADLSAHNRGRLTETLREWVTSRGTAVEIGERLQVHPQTVRYRLRQLESLLGDALAEPHTRFSVEMTLRAVYLHRRRGLGRIAP